MPTNKLTEYLDENDVKYVTISHSPSYTAQEIAAAAHVPGREFAKTVIVNIDGNMAMVVEPAHQKVDLKLLKKMTSANDVRLASEHEFKERFQECELGAMPPFGNLYDMEVFVAESLSSSNDIAFNSGSHTELVRMSFKDYQRLVKPTRIAS